MSSATELLSPSFSVPQFDAFIEEKVRQTQGRPSFIKVLAQNRDPREAVLNIVDDAWVKDRSLGNIAHDYGTKYHTIFRLLKELEFLKKPLITYILETPRRKRFYVWSLDQSDYDTVQAYIEHAHSAELRKYRELLQHGKHLWAFLGYSDPGHWTQKQVDSYLATLEGKPGAQYDIVVAVRALCPQLHETMKTGKYFDKLGRHKWDIFLREINMIHKALKPYPYEQLVFDLHVTIGAREGKRGERAGMCGITWERFSGNFTRVDDFESKVRNGILWRGCPVDLFFRDLPKRLRAMWIERGRPSSDPLILKGYPELLSIYKTMRAALSERYSGKIEPSLLKELITVHPHSADKIHVNLLWEAGVPLEVVAGQYIGRGEGVGLVGRGWLNIETIRKYYLSLTSRSKRFQRLRRRIRNYSNSFTVNKTVLQKR